MSKAINILFLNFQTNNVSRSYLQVILNALEKPMVLSTDITWNVSRCKLKVFNEQHAQFNNGLYLHSGLGKYDNVKNQYLIIGLDDFEQNVVNGQSRIATLHGTPLVEFSYAYITEQMFNDFLSTDKYLHTRWRTTFSIQETRDEQSE